MWNLVWGSQILCITFTLLHVRPLCVHVLYSLITFQHDFEMAENVVDFNVSQLQSVSKEQLEHGFAAIADSAEIPCVLPVAPVITDVLTTFQTKIDSQFDQDIGTMYFAELVSCVAQLAGSHKHLTALLSSCMLTDHIFDAVSEIRGLNAYLSKNPQPLPCLTGPIFVSIMRFFHGVACFERTAFGRMALINTIIGCATYANDSTNKIIGPSGSTLDTCGRMNRIVQRYAECFVANCPDYTASPNLAGKFVAPSEGSAFCYICSRSEPVCWPSGITVASCFPPTIGTDHGISYVTPYGTRYVSSLYPPGQRLASTNARTFTPHVLPRLSGTVMNSLQQFRNRLAHFGDPQYRQDFISNLGFDDLPWRTQQIVRHILRVLYIQLISDNKSDFLLLPPSALIGLILRSLGNRFAKWDPAEIYDLKHDARCISWWNNYAIAVMFKSLCMPDLYTLIMEDAATLSFSWFAPITPSGTFSMTSSGVDQSLPSSLLMIVYTQIALALPSDPDRLKKMSFGSGFYRFKSFTKESALGALAVSYTMRSIQSEVEAWMAEPLPGRKDLELDHVEPVPRHLSQNVRYAAYNVLEYPHIGEFTCSTHFRLNFLRSLPHAQFPFLGIYIHDDVQFSLAFHKFPFVSRGTVADDPNFDYGAVDYVNVALAALYRFRINCVPAIIPTLTTNMPGNMWYVKNDVLVNRVGFIGTAYYKQLQQILVKRKRVESKGGAAYTNALPDPFAKKDLLPVSEGTAVAAPHLPDDLFDDTYPSEGGSMIRALVIPAHNVGQLGSAPADDLSSSRQNESSSRTEIYRVAVVVPEEAAMTDNSASPDSKTGMFSKVKQKYYGDYDLANERYQDDDETEQPRDKARLFNSMGPANTYAKKLGLDVNSVVRDDESGSYYVRGSFRAQLEADRVDRE